MKVAFHGREVNPQSRRFVERVLSLFKDRGAEIIISEKFADSLKAAKNLSVFNENSLPAKTDFLISIGGDGTLLESITYIGNKEIPVLGINTGRLGFLATISKDETEEAVKSLINREIKISSRTLIELDASPGLFGSMPFALNDFTIIKKDSSMIRVEVYVNNDLLNAYWADGIIVATPTGSTGYSLSCGGPLVYPLSESFVITPVSPHNLTVRPIILSDDVELEFRVEGRAKNFQVSLDSRYATIDSRHSLKIRKAPFRVNLVNLNHHHYFSTLRQKLNWGLDIRN
jgi:NAD+ kinase